MSQSIEQQIQQYLPLLGNDEKRSVLSVIKSFINLKEKSKGSGVEYDEAFIAELNKRAKALENGSVTGLEWEEVKRHSRL